LIEVGPSRPSAWVGVEARLPRAILDDVARQVPNARSGVTVPPAHRGGKHPFDRPLDGERGFVIVSLTNGRSDAGAPQSVTPRRESQGMVAIYAPRDHELGDEAESGLDDAAAAHSRWNAPESAPERLGARRAAHLSVVAPAGVAVPARRRPLDHPPEPAVRPVRTPRRLPDRATRVRRRRLVAVVGLVLAVALAVVGVRALVSVASVPSSPEPAPLGDRPVPVTGHTYVVQPGDTLWSIARTIAPDRDPRPVVDALRKANGGANLEVGDRLTLDAG
jgi:LysM domain